MAEIVYLQTSWAQHRAPLGKRQTCLFVDMATVLTSMNRFATVRFTYSLYNIGDILHKSMLARRD